MALLVVYGGSNVVWCGDGDGGGCGGGSDIGGNNDLNNNNDKKIL